MKTTAPTRETLAKLARDHADKDALFRSAHAKNYKSQETNDLYDASLTAFEDLKEAIEWSLSEDPEFLAKIFGEAP